MFKKIWEDCFQQDGRPDPNIWSYETGGHGFGNEELQYYTDDPNNSFVKHGCLYIIGRKEKKENCEYTSAKLVTYPKKLIQQGRIEVMAKLPKGGGTWPAIWFLGENFKKDTRWPLCGEIDLMEYVGHHPDQVHFSLHKKDAYFHLNNHPTKVVKVNNLTEAFHEYALEWADDYLAFFLDGEQQFVYHKKSQDDETTWPFNQPFYLIINLALGGTWGGEIEDDMLPTEFIIKHVKVYERI